MKSVYIVFVCCENTKYYAFSETIKTGENLMNFMQRYNPIIAHLCETRTQAEMLSTEWNASYKRNGTNLY